MRRLRASLPAPTPARRNVARDSSTGAGTERKRLCLTCYLQAPVNPLDGLLLCLVFPLHTLSVQLMWFSDSTAPSVSTYQPTNTLSSIMREKAPAQREGSTRALTLCHMPRSKAVQDAKVRIARSGMANVMILVHFRRQASI